MKIIKLVLISAVVLFALIMALSVLLPSHVRISRAIDIRARPESIMPFVKDMQKWKEWNQFIRQADSMKTLTIATSNFIRTSQLEIHLMDLRPDTIHTEWKQPNGKIFTSDFAFINSGEVTTLQWYFDFHLQWYPWQKFQSIIYDKQMGPSIEKSLENLRRLVE